MDFREAVGQRILLAFDGKERPSVEAINALKNYRPAGISLFRSLNIDNPGQIRQLVDEFQYSARKFHIPPLLIATDQEGGQLMAMGDGTPLPGNMALGAAGSERLSREAGEVLGKEMAAVGVNVDYAPCVDVNLNPRNPVVGIRSFGGDSDLVGKLGAAMVEGIQSQGVAATAKHFPGHGDTTNDSHHGMANVLHSLERLRSAEFPPFEASIKAGVKIVMSAHLGLPALDGKDAMPATLSRNVLTKLLRGELGFSGVIVTDALDMHAIKQGDALGGEAVKALQAGADLLLVTSDPADQARVYEAVLSAVREGCLDFAELNNSVTRVNRLKTWLRQSPPQPGLDVIRSPGHLRVAAEIARKSITLVRDDRHLLPLRLTADQRIAVITPRPLDLTPADTSSYVVPTLARALREFHSRVDEFLISSAPAHNEIGALVETLRGYDLIIMGTLNAFEQTGQAAIANELINNEIPVVMISMRLPYDLSSYPKAPVYLCTYSLLEPSLSAAANCLFGRAEMTGRLPVEIPNMFPLGYRLER